MQPVYRVTALLGLGVVLIALPETPSATSAAGPTPAEREATPPARRQEVPARHQEVFVTPVPRGDERTIAVSKLADDGTVVGLAPPEGNVLRWTPGASAPEDLGGGPTFMLLNRVPLTASDGSTIAVTQLSEVGQEFRAVPIVWSDGAWQPLPGLTLPDAYVNGMSRNGARLVGLGWEPPPDPSQFSRSQPWAWSARTGQRILPVSPEMAGGEAWAIGNNGRVVVGQQFQMPDLPNPRRRNFATRWTDDEIQILTDHLGTPLGQAFSCDRHCSVIVGGGQGGDVAFDHPNFGQAWYWTERTGAVYLGTAPDAAPGTTSYATDITADGSVIIGTYYVADPDGAIHYRGFVWTARTGMVPILDLLAAHGIDTGSDWQTLVPTAITSRGDMILIAGLQADLTPGGFVIHLPRKPDWRATPGDVESGVESDAEGDQAPW